MGSGILLLAALLLLISACLADGDPANSASMKSLEPPKKQRDEDLLILEAAAKGSIEKVQQAIYAGANLEARDGDVGNTPLIWAAFHGHIDCLAFLIKKKANINAVSLDSEKTALLLASYSGHAHIVTLLLDKGALIDEPNSRGDTSVAVASYMNRTEVVDVLLSRRANLAKRTKTHLYTPLHLAAYKGHAEIVGLLLSRYPSKRSTGKDEEEDEEEEDEDEESGSSSSSSSTARDRRLDIDAQDKQGNSPLLLAAMQGHLHAAHLLLQAGARLSLVDGLGNTALMIAVNKGQLEMVSMLLEWLNIRGDDLHPGDVDADPFSFDDSQHQHRHQSLGSARSSAATQWQLSKTNSDGQTPMLRACIKGYTPIFNLLLMRGSDLHHKGNDGKACVEVAKEQGWNETMRIIGEYLSFEEKPDIEL